MGSGRKHQQRKGLGWETSFCFRGKELFNTEDEEQAVWNWRNHSFPKQFKPCSGWFHMVEMPPHAYWYMLGPFHHVLNQIMWLSPAFLHQDTVCFHRISCVASVQEHALWFLPLLSPLHDLTRETGCDRASLSRHDETVFCILPAYLGCAIRHDSILFKLCWQAYGHTPIVTSRPVCNVSLDANQKKALPDSYMDMSSRSLGNLSGGFRRGLGVPDRPAVRTPPFH